MDGELPHPKLPLIPGHEIIGTVAGLGQGVARFKLGDRVGIPWLGWTDGSCRFCQSDRENLCAKARFTGYTIDGGYADYTVADQPLLLCHSRQLHAMPGAGAADVRGTDRLSFAGEGRRGEASGNLRGFGAAAHIIAQVARYQGRKVFAFTRRGDEKGQEFARSLGAAWAGDSDALPPEALDAAIIFAPVGALVPQALQAVDKGGVVVCAGIHMSDIPSFPYEWLWQERRICSVANLTRHDGEEFLALAPRVPVITKVQPFPLEQANEALASLRHGKIEGAAVLVVNETA